MGATSVSYLLVLGKIIEIEVYYNLYDSNVRYCPGLHIQYKLFKDCFKMANLFSFLPRANVATFCAAMSNKIIEIHACSNQAELKVENLGQRATWFN